MISKNMKYFGINPQKYGKDLDAENYKTLMRKIIAKSMVILGDCYLPIVEPW